MLLDRNRLFERNPPSRQAKSIYIFCEGIKREYQYFRYFVELDRRINIKPYQLDAHEDNSPRGLLKIAKSCILPSEGSPHPEYQFQENDEVWIVLDIDKDKTESRKPQFEELKEFCDTQKDWFVVQSNPCFEVWLYFHFFAVIPELANADKCTNWKKFLNQRKPGGFNSRKHPIYIQNAIENSKKNFQFNNNELQAGCTEVYQLGESMLSILKEKIDTALIDIEE